ncbi:MAG: PAS domain S-box protein [Calditrichaeota bacterium]|nr:PAS domain S-box protein [Calditrichota bacterium]
MDDGQKPKDQLVRELAEYRKKIAELQQNFKTNNSDQTESRLPHLETEQIADGSAIIDLNGNFRFVTDSFSRIYDYKKDELVGMPLSALHLEGQEHTVKSIIENVIEKGFYQCDVRHVRRNGNKFPGALEVNLITDEAQNPANILLKIRNLSAFEKIEEARRESEEIYRNLFDRANDGIMVIQDKMIKYANSRLAHLLGYSIEELVGTSLTDYLYSNDLSLVFENYQMRLKGNQVEQTYEIKLNRKEGALLHAECNSGLITYEGEPADLVFVRDITQSKQTERTLKRRLELEKTVSRISSWFITASDINEAINQAMGDMGRFAKAGRAFLFYRQESADVIEISHSWFANGTLSHLEKLPRLEPKAFPWWQQRLSEGDPFLVKYLSESSDDNDDEKELLLHKLGVKSLIILPLYSGSELSGYIGLGDIEKAGEWRSKDLALFHIFAEIIGRGLERKKSAEALAAQKERLAVTLRSIGDGVISTNHRGRITLINKVAEKFTGWKENEAIGRPIGKVFQCINEKTGKRYANAVKNILEKGDIVSMSQNTMLVSKDGTKRYILPSASFIHNEKGKVIGIVLVFRDITEHRKLEEEHLKASNLESLGILAGGIAHDFNNILTTIMGNITLIKMKAPDKEVFNMLDAAEKASLRAKGLTQQLLTFSKGGAPLKKKLSIQKLIKNSVMIALSGSNVKPYFSLSDDLWPAEVDPAQIRQVFRNIAINAVHAIQDEGIFRVRAENTMITDEQALPLENGNYLKITFTDNGTGIAQDILPKVFDPYFSTEEGGSGLGLSTSYSILKKHGGYISVQSKPDEGTTFSVYLPASSVEEPVKEEEESPLEAGHGRILVMDDEENIRKVFGKMLNHLGYEVEFAQDGNEAIDVFLKARDSENAFNAVIMDLTIPGGKGGLETIQQLRKIDPEVKAVVSSGYSNDQIMSKYQDFGFNGFLTKPFKIVELSRIMNVLTKEEA